MAKKKKKLTVQDIVDKIEWEGSLSDVILQHVHADEIADPQLSELWEQAEEILKEISDIIDEFDPDVSEESEEEEDDDDGEDEDE